MNELGKEINRLRIKRKLSFSEFSKLTGISSSSLQRYTSGTTKGISYDKLCLIAKSLDVPPEYLLKFGQQSGEFKAPENIGELTGGEQKLIDKLLSLPEEKLSIVENIINALIENK